MIVEFTFDEAIYNNNLSGINIYYEEELKVIDYVKFDKVTRQLIVNCTDGDVFLARQDEIFSFEVTNQKTLKKPNRKRLKGKK
jgi:hypothetical protein